MLARHRPDVPDACQISRRTTGNSGEQVCNRSYAVQVPSQVRAVTACGTPELHKLMLWCAQP